MRRVTVIGSISLLLLAGIMIVRRPGQPPPVSQKIENTKTATASPPSIMQLTSPAFGNNQPIPAKYTCDGENISPPLTISDVPQDAKSLVLIVDDPDAPRGNWIHWLVWNITPGTKVIAEHSTPPGSTQGLTDFGENKYGGPCPPSGTHRYQFNLYALDTTLTLPPNTKKAVLEKVMGGHIISQTLLIGMYSRV